MSFRCVVEAATALGESPVWDVAAQRLWFVDITGKRLHRFDPVSDAHESWPLAEQAGCIALMRGGGLVAGMRSGIWRLDETGAQVRKVADNPEDPSTSRFNDGAVDPQGRWLLGTMDETREGRAHLYRLDSRGLGTLAGGLITSNGLAFSPDGRTLYHADTPRFIVRRYDYDLSSGEASNPRPFIQLDPNGADRGRPDGAAVDVDGCYWTALYEGGRVQRYDPDGRLMAEYATPARKPTMPRFGGADLKTLYLTSAADPSDASPGALYAVQVETPGLRAPLFDPEV